MGVLGAAMGLGVILGPGIGGWMGTNSLTLPFFVAAGLSLITLLLTLILLPESLPPGARSGTSGKIKSIQVAQLWQALFSPIGILLFMIFLVSFGLTNFESIFGLYALEKFNYGPKRVGTILMVIGIVTTAGKGALTGPLTRRWGEAKVIKLSTLAGSVGFLVLLLANTYVTILLATGFFILSKTLLRPAVLSLVSRRTTVGQGTAMGLSNAFMSLGRIIGPIWAGFAFDNNIHYPYLSGALIMLIGFLISLIGVSQENAPHYRQAVP
jgi:DHA1 family multidrug resistance protein-like MFS transporter